MKFLGQRLVLHGALRLAPRAEWASFHLGNAYAEHGFPERAVVFWARACEHPAARPAALQNLGSTLLALDRAAEAVAPLTRLCALRPDASDLHALLGRACQKAKDAAGAVRAYERALELAPTKDDLRFTAGLLNAGLARDARALEHLRGLTDPTLRAKAAAKVAALTQKLGGT